MASVTSRGVPDPPSDRNVSIIGTAKRRNRGPLPVPILPSVDERLLLTILL